MNTETDQTKTFQLTFIDKWSLNVLPRALCITYVILAILGMKYLEAVGFQRVGSLFAALAIVVLGFRVNLSAKLSRMIVNRTINIEMNKAVVRAVELSLAPHPRFKGQLDDWLDDYREHALEPVNRSHMEICDMSRGIERANLRYELVVLPVATFHWGYGDLLHNLIHCGALSCSS